MALDKTKLKTSLENWMLAPTDSLSEAADTFATAYHEYALDAEDFTGDSPLSVNKAGIISAFLSLTTSETPATSATKFETGLIQFWTNGTFALIYPPTGASSEASASVTTPIVPPAIANGLTTIFADNTGVTSVSDKATAMSNLFHTATIAVITTNTGPAITPPPPTITLLGPIS